MNINQTLVICIIFIFLQFSKINAQITNVCGNVDCNVAVGFKFEELCKKPTEISETTRSKICGASYNTCKGLTCKALCNCKVYNIANCCFPNKQCTSDFTKIVCGSLS